VTDLALDDAVTDGLFVTAGYFGIFHSTDGAASFSSAVGNLKYVGSSAFPTALVATGKTLFAYSQGQAYRLFRSSDQGSTWNETPLALPDSSFPFVASLLPSPTFATDDMVYLGAHNVKGPAVSFERSLDGGASFSPRGNGDFATVRMIWDKTHDGWLWALGTKKDAANVTSEHLYTSQDTGLTWSEVALPLQGSYDALEAATNGTGEVLYVSVFGQGLLRSDDVGATWQLVGKLPGDLLFAFAVDPTDPLTLYASCGPDPQLPGGKPGLFKSRDGGASWSHADRGLLLGQIRKLMIEPNDPQVVYAGMVHGGLYKTTSGGE